MSSPLDLLADRPWRRHAANLPTVPPTMLVEQELNLLNWLTSCYYRGEGAVIDGGCFLGGSSAALAAGLKTGVIHSYDIFSTCRPMWFEGLRKYGLEPDQSFEPQYRANVAVYRDRIEVHAGNLLDQKWSGPVEILFLDICKSPQLHDHAAELWFRNLMPGRSIVIQQDYGWTYFPWGNVMMEVYRDHFQILDDVPTSSRVYLCTKAITELRNYESIPPDDKLRCMEQALASVVHLSKLVRNNLLINYAHQAQLVGRLDLIKPTLERLFYVENKNQTLPENVREFLSARFPTECLPKFPDPELFSMPANKAARRAAAKPKPKKTLPFIIRREFNRLIGRKIA